MKRDGGELECQNFADYLHRRLREGRVGGRFGRWTEGRPGRSRIYSIYEAVGIPKAPR